MPKEINHFLQDSLKSEMHEDFTVFLSHQVALNIPQTNQHPAFVFIIHTF